MITNVVLVEDDPDDRELFIEFYKDRNDIVLLPSSENGLELIAYLEGITEENALPNLIVLDQNMPKMNGKQTLEFLKSSEKFSNIRVLVYSTYTDNNLIKECMALGAEGVAVKPIDYEGYQRMMDAWLYNSE
jgi:DNA-binding NarL/FixJ family response regulator